MKRFIFLFCLSGAVMCAAELAGVHSVYALPMAHGFDQFLVNRLANGHVFQVVTDPRRADAIFTDRLGEGFQVRLDDIFPAAVPEKPKTEKSDLPETPLTTETINKLASPALSSTFGHANGTVFLVDVHSREVVWSVYEVPKDSSSRQLDRTASDIVNRLKRDLNPKK